MLRSQWLWEANCKKETEKAAAQFILQPQYTDNCQNICEGVIINALQSYSKEL